MKRSILIVDDMDINRQMLAEAFRDKYNIIEAENGKEALEVIEKGGQDITAILLDLVMPEMDGFAVLKKMNDIGAIVHIPVFIITAEENEEVLTEAYSMGAADVVTKPFMMTLIKCRIENVIELYDHRNDLEDLVNDQVRKMSKFNQNMVEALATLVEFRDCESGGHIKRICGLTDILMNKVSSMYAEYRLPKSEIDKIVSASVLHDVGKIAIPDSILNKPGRLTPEEFEIMKEHTVRGCDILHKIPYMLNDNVYNYGYDIARHHHERWDGMGYPDNLAGDKITIWAQVVSVADVYDALVSPRVYKKAFDHDTAVKMIMNGECGTFNPKVLKAFELCLDKIKKKHDEFPSEMLSMTRTTSRLLIVDDSDVDRALLKNILEANFFISEAANGYDALAMLEDKDHPKIDCVLLDISMPVIDGFSVLKMLRERGSNLPVILMSAEATKENVERGIRYNIAGFLSKPFNPSTVVRKVHTVFSLPEEPEVPPEPSENDLSEEDINKTMVYISQLTGIYGDYLSNTGRSDEDYKRISDLMAVLLEEYAEKTGGLELDKTHINLISKAAYFFDIGRMSIPDELIRNHKFAGSNMQLYETHTQEGAHLIQLNKDHACRYFVKVCSDMCMHHHERYDGLGYPHGLKGNDIADHTRLCSLITEFDRLFSKREEINEWQFDFILKELEVEDGRFDPKFIDVLKDCKMSVVLYYKQKLKKR